MDTAALLIFAGALFVNAGSPGPSIAALVARVMTRGAGSVMPFLAAMWLGEVAWMTAAVFGLAWLAQEVQWAFTLLKIAGVGYLLWLAWKMWTAPVDTDGGTLPDSSSALGLFASGMAVTLGNPKLMAFYLALLPTLIDIEAIDAAAWAKLAAVMMAVLMTVDLAWVALAARSRRFLKSPRAVRAMHRVSGATMGGAAVVIAAK